MTTLFRKHSTLISVVLLLAFVFSAWKFPPARSVLGMAFLLFGFAIASTFVIGKHRQAHLQGRITRAVFVRNSLFEITGILLTMLLAGLLGRYLAQVAIEQFSNDLTKLVAGIVTGLLVGIGMGLLIKYTWGRFVMTPSESQVAG